ncbi:MAG TPA: hemerythrin family protein, partial [Candidatus Izemoplasmatales bacterium]|nr:hemerythrin family protein [Candidatus Izemoplasmatales bacterium]
IDIGNHLVFLAVSGAVAHQISRQIDRLLVHVANHFATEESILSETAYPELPTHQMIHKDLLRRTGELAADYLRQPTPSPIFLSFMINDLIIGHLVDEDRKFFPFLPRSVQ